jgi:hypothetical protein
VCHDVRTSCLINKGRHGLLTVQLGAELKCEWTRWCADRGLVPGKALRNLVERAVTEA